MPQDEYKFNSLEECKTQEEAEAYYSERGWNILKPQRTFDHSKCDHKWEKIKERDYQCSLCGKGFIGEPTNL